MQIEVELARVRRVEGKRPVDKRALIAVGALLATVTNAVAFMLPPLLPVITTSYAHNSVSAAVWMFAALTLGGGAGFVLIPRLTDMLSDRSMTLFAGGVLTAGALVAAIVDNYVALVIGSALLGFGSSAQFVPLSFLRRYLRGGRVSTAVMVLVMATGSGVVLGMVGGGISVRIWSLPSHLNADGTVPTLSIAPFYFILAGLFVLTTLALLAVVPNCRPESTGRLGVVNTVWLIGWVSLILLSLSAPPDSTVGKNATVILLAGVLAAAGWVVAERRASTPVFDIKVLRTPYVTTACASAGLFGCIDASFLVLANYYAQTVNELPVSADGGRTGWLPAFAEYGLRFDPLQTSLILLPFALTMFISGRYSEKLIARGRPEAVLAGGAALCGLGLLFLAVAHDQAWHYVLASGIIGLGSRAGYSAAFAIPQFVVPEAKSGMAAGMPGTIMAIGISVGAALVTILLNGSGFVYHSVDLAQLRAGRMDPSAIDLRNSDYLLDGAHMPSADAYTTAYFVSLVFPALVVVATILSRRRHKGGFTAVLAARLAG
ncbi:MFS transporter [Nocardia nova]|jgi:MFS family permease|uniref:MFS transporter n=1 Tax=Nocardia nova TaxID=37330 RepID=UPI0009EEA495|nr:MFS transporter [Nocardia nova]